MSKLRACTRSRRKRGSSWLCDGTREMSSHPIEHCTIAEGRSMNAPDSPPLEPRAAAPRALIVDDDPGFLAGLAELVKREGFSVASASTLKQARAEIAARLPDILLVDLNLPDGSGLDLLEGFEPGIGARGRPDHRKRLPRDRRRCPSPRRRRLPDEARGFRARQDGPCQRDPRAGNEGRDQLPARRAAQAGPFRTAHRRLPAHAEGLRPDRPSGRDRRQHPRQRRDRHRKGAGRRDDPPPEPPQQSRRSWR